MHNCRASLLSAIGAINVTISLCTGPGDLQLNHKVSLRSDVKAGFRFLSAFYSTVHIYLKKDPSTSDSVTMVPSRLTHKINKASFSPLFNMSSLLHYRYPRKQPEQLVLWTPELDRPPL